MSAAAIKAVIFDIGGVLIPSPFRIWKEAEKQRGLKEGSLVATLRSQEVLPLFRALEKGESNLVDFEGSFSHFYKEKFGVTPGLLFIDTLDLQMIPEMITAVEALKAKGIKAGVITNNFFYDRAHLLPTIPADSNRFEVVVESCRVGISKPDPAIYELALQQLGVRPEEALFIDDLKNNVKGASDLGMETLLCVDPLQTIGDLEKKLRFPLSGLGEIQ